MKNYFFKFPVDCSQQATTRVELNKEMIQTQSNVFTTKLRFVPIKKDLQSSSLKKVLSESEISKVVEDLKPDQEDLFIACLGPSDDVVSCKFLSSCFSQQFLFLITLFFLGHSVRSDSCSHC